MQFYQTVKLYKTPLDPNYGNVYDGYLTYGEYEIFLDRFEHKTLGIARKSAPDVNGNFTIIVAGDTSMSLHDYNYICFNTGELERKFAFIVGIRSVNDGKYPLTDDVSSCAIDCKLDAWTNNYFEFLSKSQEQHLIRNTISNQGHRNSLRPTEFSSLSMSAPVVKFDRISSYIPYNNLIKPGETEVRQVSVLWQRVFVNETATITLYEEDDATHPNRKYANPFYPGSTRCMFMPVAVIDAKTNKPIKQLQIDTFSEDPTKLRAFAVFTGNSGNGSQLLRTSALDSADYTYFPPFLFAIDYLRHEGTIIDDTIVTIRPKDTSLHVRLGIAKLSKQIAFQGYCYFDDHAVDPEADNDTYDIPKYPFPTVPDYPIVYNGYEKPPALSLRYARGDRYAMWTVEQAFRNPPFMQYSLRFGGQEYPLSYIQQITQGGAGLDPFVRVFWEGMKSPSVFVYMNGQFVGFQKSKSNGTCTISRTNIDQFLQENQGKMIGGAVNAGLSLAGSLISAGVTAGVGGLAGATGTKAGMLAQNQANVRAIGTGAEGTIGAVGSLISLTATLADENNKMDTTIVPSADAIDDIYEQDEVFVLFRSALQDKQNNIADMMRYVHCNGIGVDYVNDIRYVERDFFDYYQTDNCQLCGNMNADDRIELNSAFNRGIRRWHLDRAKDSALPSDVDKRNAVLGILMEFDKTTPNMYRWYVEQE